MPWALAVMAPLTLAGAALASHGVQHTVGFDLVDRPMGITAGVIIVAVAFALTSLFNVLAVPTSTIQILVFTVAGVTLAAGDGVRWPTIVTLAVVWVIAPPVAGALGFALTKTFDLTPATHRWTATHRKTDVRRGAGALLGVALTAVGALASFSMGANDVVNAAGSLVGTGTFTALAAGTICGFGLAVGVLTWGRPLLRKVAFDIVTVDRSMATAAQLVQAAVVLTAVAFGLFTSMNQALVGAMAGAGLARGRHTIKRASLYGILRSWIIGPAAGIAAGFLIALAAGAAGAGLN